MLNKSKISYILASILIVTLLTSCGTSGKVYNVGTGELLPKNKNK